MNRYLSKLPMFLLCALLFALTLSPAIASTLPQQISYQGYLTATDGTPINKSVTLQLSLYDSATGATPLWTEQQVVQVASGQFSVNIGAATPIALTFDKPYYLGIKVDTDQEMSPRQAFTSSPYAMRAAVANGVADNSVTSTTLQDSAVTASKLGITCLTGQILTKTATGWGCGSTSTSSTGTITGIIAGNGVTVSGTTASPQIDVNFAGTGTANTTARSDHDHDTVYSKKIGKLAVVAKSGGDYSTPSAALTDVAKWCGVPSATNPCLVKIMPGVYDQGSSSLSMLNYVDMQGSGETNTIITGSIDSTTAGVVNGARGTLKDLTVKNSGSANAQNAIAIFNTATKFNVTNVEVESTGATYTFAIYNAGGTSKFSNSQLNAAYNSIFNASEANTSTINTTFVAGAYTNNGTISCVASLDNTGQLLNSTCPSIPSSSIPTTPTAPVSIKVSLANIPTGSLVGAVQASFVLPTGVTPLNYTASGTTGTYDVSASIVEISTGSSATFMASYTPATRTLTFARLDSASGFTAGSVMTINFAVASGVIVSPSDFPSTATITSLFNNNLQDITGASAPLSVIISASTPAPTPSVTVLVDTVLLDSDVVVWVDSAGAKTASCGASSLPATPAADSVNAAISMSGVSGQAVRVDSATISYTPANISTPSMASVYQIIGTTISSGSTVVIPIRVATQEQKNALQPALACSSTIYNYYTTITFNVTEMGTNRQFTVNASVQLRFADFIDK